MVVRVLLVLGRVVDDAAAGGGVVAVGSLFVTF